MSNIPSTTYAQRQKTVVSHAGAPVLLAGYVSTQLSGDMAAKFQQEASFLWLTGIEVPGWSLILVSENERHLVAPEVEAHHEVFDGSLSHARALEISGATSVLSQTDAMALINVLSEKESKVFSMGAHPHAEYFDFVLNPAPADLWKRLEQTFKTVSDVRSIIAKLRAIKTDEEIELVKQAIAITAEAFEHAKTLLPSLANEYELEAEFTYAFGKKGYSHAYEPIVAGGKNACTLHYIANNELLPENGLVLLDIGARVNHYAADITRTYAIGKPSDREKAVHTAVEKAHHQIIALLAPGVSVEEYHNQVDQIMKDALNSLGLLKTKDDYRKYFPHAISHGLGVDVHDSLGAPKEFAAGMVLTVEPGIYIPEEGIGVRIEDDILITKDGFENLSKTLSTSL